MRQEPSPELSPLLRRYFLLDVCRFCRSLPVHRRFVDERLSVRPGRCGFFRSFRLRSPSRKTCAHRNCGKKFSGTGRAAANSKFFLGRIAPSRTAIADMRGFVSTFGPSSSKGSAKAQVTGRRRQAQASRRRFRTHISAKFVHGEVILHVKPPLTWLSHWRLSRKTGPLSWNRLRGREKATDRRARAALHARGGGPILEDEEIRALRMR